MPGEPRKLFAGPQWNEGVDPHERSGITELGGRGRGLSPLLPQPPRSLVIGMLCSPGGFGGLSFASIALKLSTRRGAIALD